MPSFYFKILELFYNVIIVIKRGPTRWLDPQSYIKICFTIKDFEQSKDWH